MKEHRQQKEEKAFYVSILPCVLKATAKTHFVIASTFLSRKQQYLSGCS